MSASLDDHALDILFRGARSFSYWKDSPVTDEELEQIYGLMKMGPTAANSGPARIVFITSEEAKAKLKPCLDEGNVDKSMSAPVVAIIGMDMLFYEKLDKLFPHTDARPWFEGKPEKIKHSALLNSTLQGAYLIMAIRSLGLDAGPMSGFNNELVDQAFFPEGNIKSNFLCAIGHGVVSKLYPRSPRLSFDEACRVE